MAATLNLLAPRPAMALAMPKSAMTLDVKVKSHATAHVPQNLEHGGMAMDGARARQIFPVRSYDVGPHGNASMDAIMKYFQDATLSHLSSIGLPIDGLEATSETWKSGLVWVETKMHVAVDNYPSWRDAVDVEHWLRPLGRNALKRVCEVRDYTTGQSIARATGVLVIMDKEVRKISKMPEEVAAKLNGSCVDGEAIVFEQKPGRVEKLDPSRADYTRAGFKPYWSDLDVNGHVNNVKYINWIIDGATAAVIENNELMEMKIEYRGECLRDSVIHSFTKVVVDGTRGSSIECQHLLQLEDGSEVTRGWTWWRPRSCGSSSWMKESCSRASHPAFLQGS